jgi:hypothetical protein
MLSHAALGWIVVAPALIAGAVGLLSALLSYLAARRALEHTAQESSERRVSERSLHVWQRHLDAIETLWLTIYEFERAGALSDASRTTAIRSVFWLPEEASREVLTAL